jgi:hypothetical protein
VPNTHAGVPQRRQITRDREMLIVVSLVMIASFLLTLRSEVV